MKKTIAIIAAVVIVIAAGVGIYFGLLAYKDNPPTSPSPRTVSSSTKAR